MDQNNRRNESDNDKTGEVISWVIVFILLFAFWPVGLFLLFRKLRSYAKPAMNEGSRAGGYSASGYSAGGYSAGGHATGGYSASGYSGGGYSGSSQTATGYSASGYSGSGQTASGYSGGGQTASGQAASGYSGGVYTASGQTTSGYSGGVHTASGQTTSGNSGNGQTATGYSAGAYSAGGQTATGQAAGGNSASGQTATGQTASGHSASGQTATGHTAGSYPTNSSAANGHTASGNSAGGQTANGHAAGGYSASAFSSDGSHQSHQSTSHTGSQAAGAAREPGAAARQAVQDAGNTARQAVQGAGTTARQAVQGAGTAARQAVQGAGSVARQATQEAGATARQAAQEFGNVARQIAKEAGAAARQAASQYGGYTKYTRPNAYSGTTYTYQQPIKKKSKKDKKQRKLEKKSGKFVATILLMISVAMFIFGAVGFSTALQGVLNGTPGKWADFLLSVFFMIGAIISFFTRNIGVRRLARYRSYCAFAAELDIISISELASVSGLSVKVVTRDIRTMINDGYFGSGAYFDNELNSLVLSPNAAKEARRAAKEAVNSAEQPQAPATASKPENQYMSIILELRELNDTIIDIAISDKIDRIEELTAKIFRIVEDEPAKLPQIRRFMNYYLPTTLKLLHSYATLEKQGIKGENISSAKENIERILDTLATGYEQQLDQLFQSDALDIAADISVIENLMQQDGLKSDKAEYKTMEGV